MKNIFLSFLILVLMVSNLLGQTSTKSRYVKPTVYQKRVTTIVSEKTRYYYSLNNTTPSTINIQGPGKLRIITRGRFVSGEGKKIEYKVLYNIDGSSENIIEFSGVERSSKATYLVGSLGSPGQLQDFEIDLGRGNHTIEFYLDESSIPVATRYLMIPSKKKKQDWIAFSPKLPSEPVDLITRESTVNYYRFSNHNPLKVDIVGPTELRVLTRIENHYQMKGRIHYRIQVKEENNVINTYQLSSRRSEITSYKNDNELIPGKACEFVINVPSGQHTYEISPLDKDKNSLLGRFLLPEKDIKLE